MGLILKAKMETISSMPNLADVIVRLEQDTSLSPKRLRDLKSEVIRICKLTGSDPRITPASLRDMRPLINAVLPAKFSLTPKTWGNVRANFRAAVVHAAPRAPRQLHAEWEPLRAKLSEKRLRAGLSRFIGFCENNAISPPAVSNEVADRFRGYLEDDANVPSPNDCHRVTCCVWNKAAETVPGWPQTRLALPDHRRPRQSLPLSSFPASLQGELADYLSSLGAGDIFAKDAPRKPLRPSTVRQRAIELGLALSALAASGKDPASITSLDCLCEPDAFTAILRRYLKDDGKPRPFARNLAHTLIGLARRRLGSEPAGTVQIKELERLQRCLGPQRSALPRKTAPCCAPSMILSCGRNSSSCRKGLRIGLSAHRSVAALK
jgi:hypothetical protein